MAGVSFLEPNRALPRASPLPPAASWLMDVPFLRFASFGIRPVSPSRRTTSRSFRENDFLPLKVPLSPRVSRPRSAADSPKLLSLATPHAGAHNDLLVITFSPRFLFFAFRSIRHRPFRAEILRESFPPFPRPVYIPGLVGPAFPLIPSPLFSSSDRGLPDGMFLSTTAPAN